MRHNCSVNGSEKNIQQWGEDYDSREEWEEEEEQGKQEWKKVERNRGEKRKERGNSEGSDGERQDCIKFVVRFGEKSEEIGRINPLKLTKILNSMVGKIEFAKVLRDGNLMIGCADSDQVKRVNNLKEINGIKVSSVSKVGSRAGIRRGRKGVISRVPTNLNIEEIKNNLKGGRITNAYRIKIWKDGVKKDSETVVIEFEGDVLPGRVMIGFMCYYVREFVPKPVRCFKCQKFGHVASSCKQKQRCARCGGNHEYGKCGTGVQPKCCNCGGNHSAAFRGCEILQQQIEIQKKRVEQNLSYAEAVKQIKEKGNTKYPDRPEVNENGITKEQLEEEKRDRKSVV